VNRTIVDVTRERRHDAGHAADRSMAAIAN